MPAAPAFQQWLRSARDLDWSWPQRNRSALKAFALLQQASAQCYRTSASAAVRSSEEYRSAVGRSRGV